MDDSTWRSRALAILAEAMDSVRGGEVDAVAVVLMRVDLAADEGNYRLRMANGPKVHPEVALGLARTAVNDEIPADEIAVIGPSN